MAQALGPCSCAKYQAGLNFSRLTMKLMPPWRYSVTSLERWWATAAKPSISSTGSTTPGVGEANSTNSNPISPIGLSNRSAMFFVSCIGVVKH